MVKVLASANISSLCFNNRENELELPIPTLLETLLKTHTYS